MSITLSETPGTLAKFQRTSLKFQQTFRTPLKNLRPFVATIVSAQRPLDACRLTFDQVVFEPKHVISLLAANSLPLKYGHDWTLAATGRDSVVGLLETVFSDWVDFLFVPKPNSFVIYADHDEYTTFFANRKSNYNRVVEALVAQGFVLVENYERPL